MNLAEAILIAMEKAAPPGKSGWSSERVPVAECAPEARSCPNAKRSSFYGGVWVRRESAPAARVRYKHIATRLALALEGSPDPAGEAGQVIGVMVNESGLREDIQMGRGRSGHTKPTDKQYDDVGGQGRGPSNEACLMQILPSMAAPYGGPEALLGDTDDALDRCLTAGLEQLRYGARMCPRDKRRVGDIYVSGLYATISRYGTGSSCTSPNDGKTEKRVQTIGWVTVVIRQALKTHPQT